MKKACIIEDREKKKGQTKKGDDINKLLWWPFVASMEREGQASWHDAGSGDPSIPPVPSLPIIVSTYHLSHGRWSQGDLEFESWLLIHTSQEVWSRSLAISQTHFLHLWKDIERHPPRQWWDSWESMNTCGSKPTPKRYSINEFHLSPSDPAPEIPPRSTLWIGNTFLALEL